MVVMKLELLSTNLITIINKCLENDDLVKLIYYDCSTPWNPPTTPTTDYPTVQPTLTDPKTLFLSRIFPYRSSGIISNDQTQVNIYYPKTKITNRVIESTYVFFDVICANSLYLIKDINNNTLLRPYRIATEITKQFDNKAIDGIGILKFDEAIHQAVNDNFSALTLTARMTTTGL